MGTMWLSCGILFLCSGILYCAIQVSSKTLLPEDHFQIEYEWSYLNFTWPTIEAYATALRTGDYIPENIVPTGVKIYDNKLYLSFPKFRSGVPVTLAYIPMDTSSKTNELFIPFPSWELNNPNSCSNLQGVQSMEIDSTGVMWVLDGVRNRNSNCPPRLMLLDLNYNGLLIQSTTFPNEISLQNGGFLNDIVIDETDGGFAYISESSSIDPGLIIYSRKSNRVWKIRDRSMFPELRAANFLVDSTRIENLSPIDGIALSPRPIKESESRKVFYTPLTGFDIFDISTAILKDENLCRGDRWRTSVEYVGKKPSQTDGMIVDSKGNLYYTLLSLYGVGKWNINEPFNTSEIVDTNRDAMVWPDGFAMDQKGYLYVISNYVFNYGNPSILLRLTEDIKFRIFKLYTGSRNYLYNDY